MIWFFTPYSFSKKLFEAYDQYMDLVKDPEDWACICDGDMAFMLSDFGHHLQEYIDAYPNTGLFVCYASRSPYGHQMKPGINYESDSIKYVYQNTCKIYQEDHLTVIEQNRRIAAPLLLIKKSIWIKYKDKISEHASMANIQAVDTAISDVLQRNKEKVLLMAGIQVYHYFRHYSMGEKHILSDKLTVVIRTHSRPKMFKRCIDSVRGQSHKNIDIVVGVDNEESYLYAKTYNPTKLIRLEPRERKSQMDFPANEYISKLLKEIIDGYVLVLDDDAYLDDPMGVEKLFREIDKEWCIYIMRYRHPNGKLFPNDLQFRTKQIVDGGIDWGSFVFHTRFAQLVTSKPLYNADFYFINELKEHVKPTKWINLSLVHTDTPGLNGLTEAEFDCPNFSARTHDIVYVLGTGSSWGNNEIRISIRSFAKYFKNLRNIVVVGERPVFLDEIIHIPYEDKMGINKDARMMLKIKAACQDPRVSENFILCTDDTLLLSAISAEEINGWHDGPINYDSEIDQREHSGSSSKRPSEWYQYVKNTGLELKHRNLPDNNYDRAHAPQPINKKEFLEILSDWNMTSNRYTISNIYNNSSKIFKGESISGENVKIYFPVSVQQLDEEVKDKICMNYNDAGLDQNLKQWLYAKFSQCSKYERFITDPNRMTTVQNWFKNGCNYDEGVKIFQYFAPKNRTLQIFFEKKKGDVRAEQKLKYTLQLWLR